MAAVERRGVISTKSLGWYPNELERIELGPGTWDPIQPGGASGL